MISSRPTGGGDESSVRSAQIALDLEQIRGEALIARGQHLFSRGTHTIEEFLERCGRTRQLSKFIVHSVSLPDPPKDHSRTLSLISRFRIETTANSLPILNASLIRSGAALKEHRQNC